MHRAWSASGAALALTFFAVMPMIAAYQGRRFFRGGSADAARAHAEWVVQASVLAAGAVVAALLVTAWWKRNGKGRFAAQLIRLSRHPRLLPLGAASLFVAAVILRLTWLTADSPARLLTHSGAFESDEGVWSYLATSWCQGIDATARGEYLGGALALPYTLMQYASCKLWGYSLESARLFPALLGAGGGLIAALGLRRHLPVGAALACGGLLSSGFWFVMYQRTAMLDGSLATLCLASLVAWLAASQRGCWRLGIVAGATLGVTLWFKISALPIGAALLASAAYGMTHERRREVLRAGLGSAMGLAAVLLVAAGVYAYSPELQSAARATLEVNAAEAVLNPQLGAALRYNPVLLHAPFAVTAALFAALVLLPAGVRWRYRPECELSIAAAAWLLATVIMLAMRGYMPPRYFLPAAPAVVLLAGVGLTMVWRLAPGAPLTTALRAASILLVVASVAYDLERWLDWAWDPPRTLTQSARAITASARADTAHPVVSSPAAFNLALAGHFEPMGFRVGRHPSPRDAFYEGATHFIGAIPILAQHASELREAGAEAVLRAELTYFGKRLGLYHLRSPRIDPRPNEPHPAEAEAHGGAQHPKTVDDATSKVDGR